MVVAVFDDTETFLRNNANKYVTKRNGRRETDGKKRMARNDIRKELK
jgi:hypothetical protein